MPVVGLRHLRNIGVLTAIVALGAGCGLTDAVADRAVDAVIETASEGQLEIDRDGDSIAIRSEEGSMSINEDGTARFESDDGSWETQITADLPEAFPDVPLPAGLAVQSVTESQQGNDSMIMVIGNVTSAADTTFHALVDEYQAAGFAVEHRTAMESDDGFMGLAAVVDEAQGLRVSVTITSGENGETMVMVSTHTES